MRKIIFFTILTLIIGGLCPDAYAQGVVSRPSKQGSSKPTPIKPKLTVNGYDVSLSLDFIDTGETKQLEISTNQGTPKVSSTPAWIKITGISSNSIDVKCEPNLTTSSRDGSFKIQAGKLSVTVNVSQLACKPFINGHEWVDLGLPSGTKWATCNVGASSPSDYGNYFAWGETRPKSNYDWSSCFDCLDNSGNRWDFYKIGGNTQISPYSGHDTARENWGGTWRIPTNAEFDELLSKCTWTWTSINGKKGYEVTGPNKKSIFLPAAGYKYGTELYSVGECGYYWSSTLSSYDSSSARYLYFVDSGRYTNYYYRRCGFSVRPVTE